MIDTDYRISTLELEIRNLKDLRALNVSRMNTFEDNLVTIARLIDLTAVHMREQTLLITQFVSKIDKFLEKTGELE